MMRQSAIWPTRSVVVAAEQVTLQVGEEHVVRLEGMAAAGYEWTSEAEGGGVTVDRVEADPQRPDPGSIPAGFSFPEAFRIRGLAPGHATVRFVLRRPWEGQGPGEREHLVQVEVR
jgi:predicted secreted protein